MSISGSLATMSVQTLLDWILRSEFEGYLSLEQDEIVRSFSFRSGHITSVSSNLPSEQLGPLLLSHDLVDETQLKDLFDELGDKQNLPERQLLTNQLVEEEDLKKVLRVRVREALCDSLSWDSGTFMAWPEAVCVDESRVQVDVSLATTMDLGTRQVEQWRRARGHIPSLDMRFWVRDQFLMGSSEQGSTYRDLDRDLVACMEAGMTVNQMVLLHHGRRFQIVTRLAALLECGAIGIDRRSCPRGNESSSDEVEEQVRRKMEQGDRRGALQGLSAALASGLLASESLRSLHKELQRSVFAELSRELLGTFRVPKLVMTEEEMSREKLSEHESYLVRRIDGHWDILSLLRVSPIPEIDALLAFKELAERGVIRL